MNSNSVTDRGSEVRVQPQGRGRRSQVLVGSLLLLVTSLAGCDGRISSSSSPAVTLPPPSQTFITTTTVPTTLSVDVHFQGGYIERLTASDIGVQRDVADASPGQSLLIPTGTLTVTNVTPGHDAPWEYPVLGFLAPPQTDGSCESGDTFTYLGQTSCLTVPEFAPIIGASNSVGPFLPGGSVSYMQDVSGFTVGGFDVPDTDGIGSGLMPAGTVFVLTFVFDFSPIGQIVTLPVPSRWLNPAPTAIEPTTTATSIQSGGAVTSTNPSAATDGQRPPSEVTVLVVNGSNINGLASIVTNPLHQDGYIVLTPSDATEQVSNSIVYFEPSYSGNAALIAQSLGLPVTAVMAMPVVPPVTALGTANVLVVAGPDLAGSSG